MSFVFYAEPTVVVGDPSGRMILTGLGDNADSRDRALISVNEAGGDAAAIELNRDELSALIVDLVHTLSAMGIGADADVMPV